MGPTLEWGRETRRPEHRRKGKKTGGDGWGKRGRCMKPETNMKRGRTVQDRTGKRAPRSFVWERATANLHTVSIPLCWCAPPAVWRHETRRTAEAGSKQRKEERECGRKARDLCDIVFLSLLIGLSLRPSMGPLRPFRSNSAARITKSSNHPAKLLPSEAHKNHTHTRTHARAQWKSPQSLMR